MNMIRGEALSRFMEELTEWVNIGKASKVPYDTWRKMKKFSDNKQHFYWEVCQENKSRISSSAGDFPYENGIYFLMQKYTAPSADNIIKKENDTMKMPAMNFDFGPCKKGIALSPYGLAVSMDGNTWLTYNTQTDQTVDVTGFTFDFEGMIYKMPAAVTSIARGDMIVHNSRPMFVTDIMGNSIEVIDLLASEVKTVIPVTNMFGFNFVTKVVSFINMTNMAPSAEQPFGNIMPMLMMNAMMGNDNGDSNDFMKLMMLSSMMGGQNPFGQMFNFGGTAAGEVGSASK